MLDNNFNFKTYYKLFLRHKELVLVPLIVVFSLVSLSSLFFPKIYESSTVIRVLREQLNPLGTGKLVREDLNSMLKTLQEMVLSRPQLMRTIRKLHLDKDLENDFEMQDLIISIRENVSIQKKGAQLFTVSFQDRDPEKAMQVTNTIVNLFIEESLSLKRDEAFSSVDFIEDQLEIYRKKLVESEEALRKFKQAHIGEMPGEKNVNLVQLDRLRGEFAETKMALQEAIGKKQLIEDQLSGERPMIISMRSGEPSSAGEKMKVLEFQLSQLLANYTEKHPDIIRIRTEIELLSNEVRQETIAVSEPLPQAGDLTTLNPLYQNMKESYNNITITIGTLQAKQKVLEKKVKEYENKVLSIPNQEKEMVALQRDYNVNDKIYEMLLMKLEQGRISKHLEFSQGGTRFQVIEPAIVPITPIKPDRFRFLFAGLALGCAAGGGLVFLKEYFDTSTRGAREAEDVYKFPVLTAIPIIQTEKETQLRRRNRRMWILGSVFFVVFMAGAVTVAFFFGA
jgi:succinoglycan biosynthesis transport protein ExoP